ncbi:ATP-binding SpoIIE family protein phosphatase [Dictyobacter formicarum]|uniref:PPM-type phosphatase domain-containing protein n=1 Tax=Dictyobacter formicarum TaxID=2778368 RepID=A0ABQ3VUX8_9CHLR|nr:SpoIIE family protein phosphatase [Dictyobacter formicarum]GHO89556.1 hypothetical protein KSZ_75620 [Dictyobacter formicarum]
MLAFQVTTRKVKPPHASRRPSTRRRQRWYTIARISGAICLVGVLTGLSRLLGLSLWFFTLLPVSMSLIVARHHYYHRNTFFLTAGVALVYFGGITALQLLVHSPGTPEIIVVTTTLMMAVLFEPVRAAIQRVMERRLHLSDELVQAIEAFSSTLREEIDLDQVRERFLDVVQRTMQPESVSLWLHTTLNAEKMITIDDTDPFIAYVLRHIGIVELERLQLPSPVVQQLRQEGIEMTLPLISQGELLGLLNLGSRLNEREYTRENRSLLNTLAAQVAPALRVAQLVQAQQIQVREHARIEQELQTARQIQHSLLPEQVPQLAGWQFAPYYQPAKEVGGDFYDFLTFEDESHLGIVIGDVTGKGVPAALVMATTCTMLRTAAQSTVSPGEVLARVNELLAARIPPGMFVTCFYALLDLQTGRLCYANAGHDWPFHWGKHSVAELQATGMPLGMMPGTHYDEQETCLLPGENILLYSDGLVEAHNARHDLFGLTRLRTLIEAHAEDSSLIPVLLNELTTFTEDGWEQEDDVTLVVLQRAPLAITTREQIQDGWRELGLWSIASAPGNEREAMALVAEAVRPLGLSSEQLARLESAIAETVMNAIEHGNQSRPEVPVTLQVFASEDALIVRIRDEGQYQPTSAIEEYEEPDLFAKLAERQTPRGWGLFLIRNLVDEMHCSGDDHHHVVELILYVTEHHREEDALCLK